MQTLHVISHTHWDREWYQTFQQFRLKLVHLIDKLLDILAQDPEFKYFMLDGQTIVLDDYLLMRSEMEPVLRQHIQSGRILIGPWHILPDMFLVSPEAHIRNLLEGERTSRRFGPKMPIGYIPDPFGHPGQVPQILNGFSIQAAALWRGLGEEPAELWWQSPDGSKVLLAYLRDSYSNGANLPAQEPAQFTQFIAAERDLLSAKSAVDDFLIMFGTDHMEPSAYTSSAIAYANTNLPGTQVIHSTLPGYIQRISDSIAQLETAIPTVLGELRACDHSHLLPGVLSTRMWIKQRNHSSQTLLEKWAEPFSVFAQNMIQAETSLKSPDTIGSNRIRNVAPILRQAWRLLMENHPHDSICGCSIDQVHDEMKPRFDQVDQIGEEITLQALQAIALATDTRAQNAFSAVVIFNPNSAPRRDLVEADLQVPDEITRFELISVDKTNIPYEFLGASNQELANVLLSKNNLRDTIGTIHEGRAAGLAITNVSVSRQGAIVTIEAKLDGDGQPNIAAWRQAEEEISRFDADPGVTHYHLLAHTPRASRILFASPVIPALGWSTLWARALPETVSSQPTEVNPLLKPFLPLALRFAQSGPGEKVLARLNAGDETKPPFVIQNENFSVEASRTDGTLTIMDKRTNAIFSGLNRFVDGGDAGDEYNFSPPCCDTFLSPKLVSLKVFHHKLVQTLEIEYELKVPTQLAPDRKNRSQNMVTIPVHSCVSLIPGGERVDIHTEIENTAKDHRLRVHFPAPFCVEYADYDGHFEVVRRPLGVPEKTEKWVEEPRPETHQRAFTDVSDGKIGLMIANRGLPEVEVLRDGSQTEIALTLLRSVGWLSRDDMPVRQGHAGPAYETPGGQGMGKWAYDYAIIPHKGNWRAACQHAYAFETPLRAVTTALHPGEIAAEGSFITYTTTEFVISAVKEAESGKGWLVRGYNNTPELISLNLKPSRRFGVAKLVNLAELEISPLEINGDGEIQITIAGYAIISILFND
jgi:mannosylglycerate hydrolase